MIWLDYYLFETGTRERDGSTERVRFRERERERESASERARDAHHRAVAFKVIDDQLSQVGIIFSSMSVSFCPPKITQAHPILKSWRRACFVPADVEAALPPDWS